LRHVGATCLPVTPFLSSPPRHLDGVSWSCKALGCQPLPRPRRRPGGCLLQLVSLQCCDNLTSVGATAVTRDCANKHCQSYHGPSDGSKPAAGSEGGPTPEGDGRWDVWALCFIVCSSGKGRKGKPLRERSCNPQAGLACINQSHSPPRFLRAIPLSGLSGSPDRSCI
jgi:hypothetical protein